MRLPSLTGLRFAAALAVFGVHYPLFLGGDPRWFAEERPLLGGDVRVQRPHGAVRRADGSRR